MRGALTDLLEDAASQQALGGMWERFAVELQMKTMVTLAAAGKTLEQPRNI